MPRGRSQPQASFAERLYSLVTTGEVLRLIHDITTCEVMAGEEHPRDAVPLQAKGVELFPCFAMYFQRQPVEIKGSIYPNLSIRELEGLSHLIRLEMGGEPVDLWLRTPQATFLLSPFHIRFLSILFGRLALHHLSLTPGGGQDMPAFTPYSLEEQVVAGYLQSLEWAPCATIKLDAQDNPYIGSMLHTAADLRRCEFPGSGREEAVIRAWRLFKRLLYYSIEGERLFTGFAILSAARPLEYYRQRWPSLLLYQEANYGSLDEGVQSIKQFLLNADGRNTFLALHRGRIIGLLQLTKGTHQQLTTTKSWRTVLPLATVSHRGRISFWLALRGRQNPRIPLSVLEYRHGHLHIPLFQDIFWQELERQVKEVCPGSHAPEISRLKALLTMVRRAGIGSIILLGLTGAQLEAADTPIENQVRLAQPVPLQERWLRHLTGLAKSDGALLFNDHLEACQFRARLKATGVSLPPERDDLGSGIRHQVTREFSAWDSSLLGICVSQDGHISLYRHGKLLSRLY
ncbi:MAG: hypothetical protein HY743_01770 [Deltaproteobacteria bacterium]|nr:hypothetical protein [Deltaproteobacteria bacterium]